MIDYPRVTSVDLIGEKSRRFELNPDHLDELITKALSDPKILSFMSEAGLRDRHVRVGVTKRSDQLWSDVGSDIEEYNRASDRLRNAEDEYQRSVFKLTDSFNRPLLFPKSKLPSPDSQQATLWIYGFSGFAGACAILAALGKFWFGWKAPLAFIQNVIPWWPQSDDSLWFILSIFALWAGGMAVSFIRRRRRFENNCKLLATQFDLSNLREQLTKSKEKLDDAIVVRGILPVAREIINEHLKISYVACTRFG